MRSPIPAVFSIFAILAAPSFSLPIGIGPRDKPHAWAPTIFQHDGRLDSPKKYDKNHRFHWIGNDSYQNTERISEENSGHFNSHFERGSHDWYRDEFIRHFAPPVYASKKKAKRDEGAGREDKAGNQGKRAGAGGNWVTAPTENITIDLSKLSCQTQSTVTVTTTATTTIHPTQTSYVTATPTGQ